MWFVVISNTQVNSCNNNKDDIASALAEHYPHGHIYRNVTNEDHQTCVDHLGATVKVTIDEQEYDVLAGNTVEVDASNLELKLLDKDGEVVAVQPLELVNA